MKKLTFFGLFLPLSLGIVLMMVSSANAVPAFGGDPFPIGIGENILAAGNWNHDIGNSSDLTLIIRLDVDGKAVIDEGHKVKYLVNQAVDKGPPDWFKIDFNDSKWQDGEASVGYGDTDDWTVTPGNIPSVFTRYRFKIDKEPKKVDLFVDWDDFYLITINGVEVARDSSLNAAIKQPKMPVGNENLAGGHGSSELPKGRPNPARWKHPKIDNIPDVKFKFVGSLAVEPYQKLTTMWGKMKLEAEKR